MAGRDKSFTAPAFIHIDVDDLWAIAECYGLTVPPDLHHHVTRDALPRFQNLFADHGIKATFFLVGRDLQSSDYVHQVRQLLHDGHQLANHSHTHRLDFRALSIDQITSEIQQCHNAIHHALNHHPTGFRAPGYAASPRLTTVLNNLGYRYDASLMPSPYGSIFRLMDARLQRTAVQENPALSQIHLVSSKTQYPLLRDTLHSLWPQPLGDTPNPLIRLPSAVAPGLRLPFQAGVCMRLGWHYFRANFWAWQKQPALPFVFLFHAADLADLSQTGIPFFQNSPFFNTPINHRLNLARRILTTIKEHRPIQTTEQWLQPS